MIFVPLVRFGDKGSRLLRSECAQGHPDKLRSCPDHLWIVFGPKIGRHHYFLEVQDYADWLDSDHLMAAISRDHLLGYHVMGLRVQSRFWVILNADCSGMTDSLCKNL